ncbi:hypothetical protein K435DRAFT_776593 [Dendrothele bispora CBS 962.96]|uniref:Golgi apparatus membrane protein TVP38 n=1 Tax=Dendrothele bispora (strain CBS 962.96) TaxID=1314807 RepID=A0A4S8MD08_DENBC|nr:hypothetical protein K435DRAFT_776593 [Dendrothele bispora CBS 962.96]
MAANSSVSKLDLPVLDETRVELQPSNKAIIEPSLVYEPHPRRRHGHDATMGSVSENYIDLRAMANNRASLARTPSPTPSEHLALTTGAIDWKAMRSWRFWIRKEWFWYYVLAIVLGGVAAVIAIKRVAIIHFLAPATDWMKKTPAAWLIPIAILIVLSYPPLFGHEIVAMVCGVTWGLWIGFGVVAAGTLIGEIATFYSFQHCCSARARKAERSTISYACFARIIRQGGFKVALMIRLSVVPPHFATVVFAICQMNIFVFILAAFLTLPKQMVLVYFGVALSQSATGEETPSSKRITGAVVAVGTLIGSAAMYYVVKQMNKVKPEIIYERRKERQQKMQRMSISQRISNVGQRNSQA